MAESHMRQEVLDLKNDLKREARDHELLASKLVATVREETQKREEALEREARMRQEAIERQSESHPAAAGRGWAGGVPVRPEPPVSASGLHPRLISPSGRGPGARSWEDFQSTGRSTAPLAVAG